MTKTIQTGALYEITFQLTALDGSVMQTDVWTSLVTDTNEFLVTTLADNGRRYRYCRKDCEQELAAGSWKLIASLSPKTPSGDA